jgi:2-(1,2-epoxy-1,2-dihydrophenyl)acetyl-CoA isomerase
MDAGEFQGFAVRIEEPGVAVVTFNRPERLNGMTQAMKRDLVETLLQAQMDDRVRVMLFTGSGRAFSAGDDVMGGYAGEAAPTSSLAPPLHGSHATPVGTYASLRGISQALNRAVRDLDKVTIAAINGVAIQSGLSLAMACDFRVASTEARLGSATLRFGLLPDEGGHALLVQAIGLPKTLDFLLRKRIVGAQQALDLGLVHEVVEPDALAERSLALARELAEGPQVAMRLLKRSIYQAAETSMAAAFDDIATKAAISDPHADAREGMQAFREKRAPRFNAWLEGR